MPLQSTTGSTTVKGYRPKASFPQGDPYWEDVILLIQPLSTDTGAVDYSDQQINITAQRGTAPGVVSLTDPYGSTSNTINFQSSQGHMVTVDEVPDLLAASTDPNTWTMEGWFNLDTVAEPQVVFFGMHGNTYNPDNNPHVDNFVVFWHGNNVTTSNVPRFYKINENGSGSEDVAVISTTNTVVNQWYHLAIVNNGGTLSYYIDGTRVRQETGYTFPTVRSDDSFQLGADQDNTVTNDFFDGQCSEFRVTRNVARYTGATFVLPTERFPLFGALPGSSSIFPALSEQQALTYLNTQNGSTAVSRLWVRHPRVNGNNSFRVSAIVDNTNEVYILCGKIGTTNQNSQIVTATGKPAWTWQDNPSGTVTNDWGTDTHVYNETDLLDTGTFTTSQRTRAWPELASRYKRIFYASISGVNNGQVLYRGSRGTTANGPVLSWGELLEVLPDYNPGTNGGGGSHLFPDEAGVAVAALERYNATGTTSSAFDYLYLGFTDDEPTTTATNDSAMIIGSPSLKVRTTPAASSNAAAPGDGFGLGAKRASTDSNGFAVNVDGTTLPDDSVVSDAVGNSHGGIATFLTNGRTDYDRSASASFYVRLHGGDGTTAAKAFPGSVGDLDKIWYGGSIPDGYYYFLSTNSNLGIVRLYVEGGYIKIPTGTASLPSSDITSATLTDSNYWTKYVNGDASATTAMMTFDASNRFNNLTNTAPYNSTVGYILFDIGIPFRRSYVNLTVSSPEATGSGGTNADWNDAVSQTGWAAGNLTYASIGTNDYPFAVVPDNDTNTYRQLMGNQGQNSSTIASGGWNTYGDQGVVTRSWTSTVIDCGQAAQRTKFGLGFAGWGTEDYRFDSGFFYLR